MLLTVETIDLAKFFGLWKILRCLTTIQDYKYKNHLKFEYFVKLIIARGPKGRKC